jgi:hypothetical protein
MWGAQVHHRLLGLAPGLQALRRRFDCDSPPVIQFRVFSRKEFG